MPEARRSERVRALLGAENHFQAPTMAVGTMAGFAGGVYREVMDRVFRTVEQVRSDYHPASELVLCPKCRTQAISGARFCGNCGAALEPQAAAPVVRPETNAPQDTRSKVRRYKCAPGDTSWLIADIKAWLVSQGFDTRQLDTESEGVLLQIKKRGAWRDFVGMATSLNIVVRQSDNILAVEIGAGKWIDKAATGIVGMFVIAWPLAITAGYGAWEQMKMPEKVFDYFGNRLAQA